jgi:DNA-binding LacI/PurR family transcriptional regulator
MDMPASQDRLHGFREAMARHGHAFVPSVEGNFTRDSGEQAMHELLDRYPDLDGLFAANDLMAQGALLALHDRGIAVPDAVAVVGFDDSSAATACRPPLTTVRQPIEDMAAAMADLLLAHIDERQSKVTSRIFEPTLVVRDSA